ncbi:MAG: hypothetical protein U0519_04440 [Candidatus Gracilibacteria bacterium]
MELKKDNQTEQCRKEAPDRKTADRIKPISNNKRDKKGKPKKLYHAVGGESAAQTGCHEIQNHHEFSKRVGNDIHNAVEGNMGSYRKSKHVKELGKTNSKPDPKKEHQDFPANPVFFQKHDRVRNPDRP